MFLFGVGNAMLASAVISTIGGVAAQKQASKGFKAAQRRLSQAGEKGIQLAKRMEEEWGIPMIETSKFFGVAPGGFDAFEQAIYESATGKLRREFIKRKQAVMADMEKRGMPSSLISQTMASMEAEQDVILENATYEAKKLRYGFEMEEGARRTAFEREQALDPLRLWTARTGLASGLIGQQMGVSTAQANLEAQRGITAGQFTQQTLGTLGDIYGSWAGYKAKTEAANTIASAVRSSGMDLLGDESDSPLTPDTDRPA